jgi:hypothetical protein
MRTLLCSSFTFNVVRWVTAREIKFVIPLWNLPLGKLLEFQRSDNELVLVFKNPEEVSEPPPEELK